MKYARFTLNQLVKQNHPPHSLFSSPSLVCVQRKRTAHERAKDLFASGEFSSGRKWADDAPKEKLDTNTVNLIASGACGAFVHGLEDEMFGTQLLAFWKVREEAFFSSLIYVLISLLLKLSCIVFLMLNDTTAFTCFFVLN